MKIKKYIFGSLVALSMLFATSCNDFLDDEDYGSNLTDDVVFSNVGFTNYAVLSIYNVLGENNSYRNRLWLQMGINTDIEFRVGWSSGSKVSSTKSDDLIALYNSNSNMVDGYNNSDNANPYSRIYEAIEKANLAIEGIHKYGNLSDKEMAHLLGEALTLRAFYYLDLTKWWGDVPARFESVADNNLYMAKSDRDSIYNQIISDLQEAIPMLYSADASAYTKTTKRLSKDAARGLLARTALTAGGYSMRPLGQGDAQIKITVSDERRKELYRIAREACRDIITDGKYTLDSSFKNIFYQQCQDIETHGREAIFQLPYVLGSRGRMLTSFALPRTTDGVFNTRDVGGQFRIMPNFYYDFNSKDSRRDATVVPYKIAKNTTLNVMEETLSGGITSFQLAKWRSEYSKNQITGTDDGVSPIIIRYADVLLMYAEADLYLGETDGKNYFNMVRRRAFNQDLNSTSAYDLPLTLDNIKQERAFEFCGENIRKYDLMRWGELKSKMDLAKTKMKNLREGTGEYANVPNTLYYRSNPATNLTPGETVLEIYGLERGEFDDKTITDPTGDWTKKKWTQATTTENGQEVFYLSDNFIENIYHGNPDKRQLLPIMHQIIIGNSLLYNDYGYQN